MTEGWTTRQLGDVCTVIAGQSPKAAFYNEIGQGLPFYQGKKEFTHRLIGRPTKWTTYVTKEAEPGDILMSVRAPVGPINQATEKICIGRGLAAIRPHEMLYRDYLWYVLLWLRPTITGNAGAVFESINKEGIERLRIPLPPTEEQRRVVAILDQAFEGLDRARAHTEINLENGRAFFLSTLREVFRNDSRKWESNLPPDPIELATNRANAEVTRKGTRTGGRAATLRPIMGPYSLSVLDKSVPPRSGWKWTRLSDLARLESGHTPSRKHSEYWGGDVPWIGIKDARDHHGRIIEATLENTNDLGISNSSARILPPDTVCLSRTASVGYVTVMGREMATSQDFVNWVCGDALLPEFLKFLLLAQGDEIRRFASGSVHQTIYFPEVKSFNICHPPVSVQREICNSLDYIAQESAELVDSFEAKLLDLNNLRQSFLERAFTGELT